MNNPAPTPRKCMITNRRAFTRRRAALISLSSLLLPAVGMHASTRSFAQGALTQGSGHSVDLALLLAIDCSYSVNQTEYDLQTQGLAAAFLDPEIIKASVSGPHRRIAIAVMQWSSEFSQILALPWTIIDGPRAALRVSSALSGMQRQTADGATALGDALAQAGKHLDALPYPALRQVIDVSGDGRKNTGSVVTPVRDHLIDRGVTINALAILNEDPELDLYYANTLAGGAGSFTMVANDYHEYRTAMRKKLLREIRFVPVSDAGTFGHKTPPA